ncbi:NHLP bacteriocin system secretion protein [Oscillospiraceae bacterium PP1C4]
MAQIFRKAAIDRISSPEQLDRMLSLTAPRLWLSLLGAGVIICITLTWSVLGRLPIAVDTQGVYVNSGGSSMLCAKSNGIVSEILVREGQDVPKGEAIVLLQNNDIKKQLEKIEQRITQVEAITFTSESDVVTADTQSLADLKVQGSSTTNSAATNTQMLAERKKQLEAQEPLVADLKSKMNSASRGYFATLDDDQTNLHNFKYQKAANTYAAKEAAYSAANSAYQSYLAQLGSTPPDAAQAVQLAALKAQVEQAREDFDDAETTLTKTEKRYSNALSDQGDKQQYSSIKSDAYNKAQTEYTSANSVLQGLRDAVTSLELQIKSDTLTAGQQALMYESQFRNAKNATLSQLNNQRNELKEQLAQSQVCAVEDGTVYNIAVAAGSIVGAGTPIASVMYGDAADMTIVLYVPVAEGKKVKSGMDVMVYPSTVNRQEYGHMVATVTSVDAYVTSSTQMQKLLGSDSLVNAFSQDGPVVAVYCTLEKDKNTASGYRWSSKKGAEAVLTNGTMISASVIVDRKIPITMLIPYLKEKLTIKVSTNSRQAV